MSRHSKQKEKRPLTSDSDSGPDDRGPAPKGAKKEKPGNPYKSKYEAKPQTSKPTSNNSKDDEEPSWDLGRNKWVKIRPFKGTTYIDIREYYVDKETMETRPGKKGISLNCEQYQKLKVRIFSCLVIFSKFCFSQLWTTSTTPFPELELPRSVATAPSELNTKNCDQNCVHTKIHL
jgi:hypothetical protein